MSMKMFYIVRLEIANTRISFRSLLRETLAKSLVGLWAVLSPLSIATASQCFFDVPLLSWVPLLRAEVELGQKKEKCWDTNLSGTTATGKVDWTPSAPATTSGSLVDGACLRDAHPTNANIQWAERAKPEVLSTQVSPSQGRSRSEDLPLQIAI